ncbi:MAG: hypothetical protein L3J08_03710 [Flavobacteriaceae bacterium]|nr:hypothetical protein [Flavobacteriaceae bacterium]
MRFFIIILITLFFELSYSQELETKLINTFDLKADIFCGIDDLNSIYYIKNNIFYKKSNKKILNYSNFSLGEITSVDIHNSFKIVLFYKNFNSIIILDNNLNELTNKIDFTKETLFNNIILVSHTSENNLWLFADDNKLHLFDFKNKLEKIKAQPISFYQENFIPKLLKSTYKNIWVLGETGVIQINEYGNFINYFEIEQLDFILPFQKGFISIKDQVFKYIYENKSLQILIDKDYLIKNAHANNTTISIFDGQKVYQYEIL